MSPGAVLLSGHSVNRRRGAPALSAAGPSRPLVPFRPRVVSPHAWGSGGCCALQAAGAEPRGSLSVWETGRRKGRRVHLLGDSNRGDPPPAASPGLAGCAGLTLPQPTQGTQALVRQALRTASR